MKFKYLAVLLLVLVPATVLAQGTTLKVMSYNLRFGELASLEELAEFIKVQDPDIIALQEVDVRTSRPAASHQNGKDFVTELGYRTGMLTAYGKAIPYEGGYYGVAILSKYPLTAVKRVFLPKPEGAKEQRVVLVADVEYADYKYFTFACTHLDNKSTDVRQAQVKKLTEILMERAHPVILAGDFNATPESKEIMQGMEGWERMCRLRATFSTSNPTRKIDYIFAYPKDRWSKVESLNYDVQLSDHFPVGAVVELLP